MNLEKITEFITVESVDLNMKATNKSEVIVELTKLLEKSGKLDNIDKTLEALKEREKLNSEPFPGSLVKESSPPRSSTRLLDILKPRPVPPCS